MSGEEQFFDRLQVGVITPAFALLASALGGVLAGLQQATAAGTTGTLPTASLLAITNVVTLFTSPAGLLIAAGVLVAFYEAGLFGVCRAILEALGGNALLAGNPAGLVLIVVGAFLVILGWFVPWMEIFVPNPFS